MLTPLDCALLPALLCALSLVPATLATCHALQALASLARPVAADLTDAAGAILRWIWGAHPYRLPATVCPTVIVPLTGCRSVDLVMLRAFA